VSRGRNAALAAAKAAHAEALVHPQGTPSATAYALHYAAEAVEDEGGDTGLALPTSASYAMRDDDEPMGVEAWARQALQPADRVPAYERHLRLYVRLGCDVHGCTEAAKVLVVLPRGAEGFRCVSCLRAIYADLPAGALTVGIAGGQHSGGEAWDTCEERAIEHERGAYESLSARGVL
jgi:hypothetical protein